MPEAYRQRPRDPTEAEAPLAESTPARLPRKLYWAERLGLLIMADVPNSCGEPDDARGGTLDPSRNPNSYPMTDETRFPSAVTVYIHGAVAGRYDLRDDPADHHGILSWHAQLGDRRLREAGSYGDRLHVPIPRPALVQAAADGAFNIRLEVDSALPGGLALYGAHFGRYPLDPTLILTLRPPPQGR